MLLSLAAAALLAATPISRGDTVAPPHHAPRVAVIPIHGEIDPTLQSFVERAIAEVVSSEDPPEHIVFDIDTWGGRLDAAFAISDTISAVKQCSTSAFVARKAISAGALIALSTQGVYMAPGATIGDCAPILQTSEGPQFVGEKVESPLRARFRALARRNGIPVPLAEKMVSKDLGVVSALDSAGRRTWFPQTNWDELPDSVRTRFREARTVIPDGQLLTLDDAEALEYGFSRGTYRDAETFREARGWAEYHRVETNWSEDFARWLSPFVPILFLVGLAALYLEYKSPGFGFFGILGIACLGLALGSQHLVGLADNLEFALAALGILLVVIEVLLFPGTGLLAGLGLLSLLSALILSLQDFALPTPGRPDEMAALGRNAVLVLGSATGALVLSTLGARFLLPHLPGRKLAILTETLADLPESPHSNPSTLVGKEGVVLRELHPVGVVEIEGQEFEAISESGLLKSNAKVRVIRQDGLALHVESIP